MITYFPQLINMAIAELEVGVTIRKAKTAVLAEKPVAGDDLDGFN